MVKVMLSLPADILKAAKSEARKQGFTKVQQFIRELFRERYFGPAGQLQKLGERVERGIKRVI